MIYILIAAFILAVILDAPSCRCCCARRDDDTTWVYDDNL